MEKLDILRNSIINGIFYMTGSVGFSFSQFPEETEKEASRYAGKINLSCCVFVVCHATHVYFDAGPLICRLWRHGGFVLPSGKDKRTIKII
jgi:hypothetical protein